MTGKDRLMPGAFMTRSFLAALLLLALPFCGSGPLFAPRPALAAPTTPAQGAAANTPAQGAAASTPAQGAAANTPAQTTTPKAPAQGAP